MNGYQLKQEAITINNVTFDIDSLKDRQQFHDAYDEADALGITSATWSLFGVVWPSSIVLASIISLQNLANKRVLEIGCGIGLSSIVLHKLGFNITASDYHPLAKKFLDHNVLGNQMDPIRYRTGNWETENPHLGQFDVIIGSDVLYEPAHVNNVSRFIDTHSSDSVEVMIVDPNRSNRSRFSKRMDELGYTHHFDRFIIVGDDQKACKGRILHYLRGS